MPAKKKRSSGGGRTSNSEPKVQVFKDFAGCNFELAESMFDPVVPFEDGQTDLQMTYMMIQNNAVITSNKTIETRNNLVTLFDAGNKEFSGVAINVDSALYFGFTDGSLARGFLMDGSYPGILDFAEAPNNRLPSKHDWESFSIYRHSTTKFLATTEQNKLWEVYTLGSKLIYFTWLAAPHPETIDPKNNKGTIIPHGDLKVSATSTTECYCRVSVAYTYVTPFGPTACSDTFTFYTNYPVDEWTPARYVTVQTPTVNYDPLTISIRAIEVYYTVDNSSSLVFTGRSTDHYSQGDSSYVNQYFTFDWYGYLDAADQWAISNLEAPTQDYSSGPPCSHVTFIDGRYYFWGDKNHPNRLYIGGNAGNELSISPGTGGGFVDIEPTSSLEIKSVVKYKTQSGASIVTILCNAKNSSLEQRFNLVENSVSLSNEQSRKSWQAEQVAGAIGCKSYNGAIVCEDGLYAISRYGLALTTMTMEYNAQIRVNYVSDPVKPMFTERHSNLFEDASIVHCDGVLYLAIGKNNVSPSLTVQALDTSGFGDDVSSTSNLILCYDIDTKAWWTITIPAGEEILNLFHIDYEGAQEGVGIVTKKHVYMLPTTKNDIGVYARANTTVDKADYNVHLQTGLISTSMPLQNWFYLSQLEFKFDYFNGSVLVQLKGIDQFGREVTTYKNIKRNGTNITEYMRVDLRLQAYQIRITGQAKFRMTHFMAKVYPMSAKQGMVWGFDDAQDFRQNDLYDDIHPTFKDYNDVVNAIIV